MSYITCFVIVKINKVKQNKCVLLKVTIMLRVVFVSVCDSIEASLGYWV